MTQIEMPFLQRMFSATRRSTEPRLLAAWDMERIDLEELSRSDFDLGADLAGRTTLLCRGHHWASLTRDALTKYSGPRDLATALKNMAEEINTTRFFDEGKISLARSSILLAPPKDHHVRRSEREMNVSRLRAWAAENMLSIEGEVFIRVREPALRLDIGYIHGGQYHSTVRVADLKPYHTMDTSGFLTTINEKQDLLDIAKEYFQIDKASMMQELKGDAFERLSCATNNTSEVAARSLVGIAMGVRWDRPAISAQLTMALDTMEENLHDEDKLTELADLLVDHVHMFSFPVSAFVRIAVERWNDRPITPGHAPGMHL